MHNRQGCFSGFCLKKIRSIRVIRVPPKKLSCHMKHRLQIWLAVLLVCFGVVLITVAFIAPPLGVIDPTVLTAFGEILTFAGSLIGIDYHYRYKGDSSLNLKP